MKISELMELLAHLQYEYGDLDVEAYSDNSLQPLSPEDVRVWKHTVIIEP